MTSTTMTPITQVPLCRDQAFKDEMVQRISTHIEDEVRDFLNTRILDGDLDNDLYQDELSAMLSYLDDNLSIFIK